MKKWICLLLCLLIAAGLPALAAASPNAVEYKTYTNATYGYKIDYPAEWAPLDNETIDDYLAQISSGEIKVEGFTASALDTVKSLLTSGNNIGFVEFMDWGGNNFNVTSFAYPTPPSIEEANQVLSPQIVAMYQSMLNNLTVLDSGSIFTAGSTEFVQIKCQSVMNGQTITMTSLYYFSNGLVFNIVFSWSAADPDEEIRMGQILNTVTTSFAYQP